MRYASQFVDVVIEMRYDLGPKANVRIKFDTPAFDIYIPWQPPPSTSLKAHVNRCRIDGHAER